MKTILSIAAGLLVAMALILLMTSLIAEPLAAKPKTVKEEPDFPEIIEQDKPDPVRTPPKPPTLSVEPVSGEAMEIVVEQALISPIAPSEMIAFELAANQPLSPVAFAGTELMMSDRQLIPLFQSQPKYPIQAQIDGIEGWVKLSYDVSPAGVAINIQVLDSYPKRTFVNEAKQALKRWKFKAAKYNGKAIGTSNQAVKMEFNLENQ